MRVKNCLRLVRDILFRRGYKFIFASKKIKLFMYDEAINFGDQLNIDLMHYFSTQYVVAPPTLANVLCIGSILDNFVERETRKTRAGKKVVSVFGSGFMFDKKYEQGFSKRMKFYAVRGKLTKSKCNDMTGEKMDDTVLGDPGLLASRMFPNIAPIRKYDIGIVCHMHDKGSGVLKNITPKDAAIKYIDVQQSTASFVREATECKFILSSAMHGLICADAFGIPNKHIILSDKVEGANFKFRDYYSVFPNFDYRPIDLRKTTITSEDIEKYKKEYNIKPKDVNKICNELEGAFGKMMDELTKTIYSGTL